MRDQHNKKSVDNKMFDLKDLNKIDEKILQLQHEYAAVIQEAREAQSRMKHTGEEIEEWLRNNDN